MNIFILDYDIKKCAQYHCDKHVVKMITEYAQILSTTVRESGIDAGYKSCYKNHPCTIWCRESLSNWFWLRDLSAKLFEEYSFRYDKYTHKAFEMIKSLPEPDIDDLGMTEFALAMPDYCKVDDVVESYRNYYREEKKHLHNWKLREIPEWIGN